VTVHEHVQQVLSAWRDGEADPDQRFLAERHLGQCTSCQAAAEAFARVDERAREVLLLNGPAPSFEAALAARLAAEPGGGRPGRRTGRRRRLWLGGLAAALTVLVLVLVSVDGPSGSRGPLPPVTGTLPGPQQPSTLAAVVVRAEQVAHEVRTLQGRFTRTWSGMPARSGSTGTVTGSYRFVYASPDQVRIQGGPGAEVRLQIHDGPAARRVLQLREDPEPLVTTGVVLARPQDLDALAPLREGLTLWFRHRLEDPEQPASLATRAGRRVYVLRLRYGWSAVAGPPQISHLEVWLDPASYLPTRIQYQDRTRPGRVVVRGDLRYTYQRVNRPVPPGAFAVPPGAQVASGGEFRSMPLARAQALASYPIPEVKDLPRPGWRLLRSGFAPVGQPTGPEAGNPVGRDLVVAVHGSGLERLVMTSLLIDDPGYADPFAGEGAKRATRNYRLRGGAYAGTVAHLGLPSDDAPYLWLQSSQVVVTLSGAATARQLVAAAESLTH
jgi:hypothetical protein